MQKKSLAIVLVSAALFSTPMQAQAADSACVSLLVGAGYAAKMRIESGDFKTDWSKSFPIGKTVCQSLDGVPVGSPFTVQVQAVMGKTKACTPNITHSTGAGSITFQAWGTTLNVKCTMPTVATAK